MSISNEDGSETRQHSTERHATSQRRPAGALNPITLTFQDLINSSLVHSLPFFQISWKSTHHFLNYHVYMQPNKQMDKRRSNEHRPTAVTDNDYKMKTAAGL